MSLDRSSGPQAARPPHCGIKAAACYLGVSRSRLYELLRDGSIPALKLGSRTLIPVGGLDSFIAKLPAAAFQPLPRQAGKRS
ncbi:MAG: excisionase family DNA-binding protein [Hyphomicrobiaceae bacterium]